MLDDDDSGAAEICALWGRASDLTRWTSFVKNAVHTLCICFELTLHCHVKLHLLDGFWLIAARMAWFLSRGP